MTAQKPNTLKSKKNVAVLMGGTSVEKEVSMASGRACSDALRQAGYNTRDIIVTDDLQKLTAEFKELPDVVFNALHGKGGEDGCIQGFLDLLGVPYTHSGRLSSAVCMNKKRSKNAVAPRGVPCAKDVVLTRQDISLDNVPFDPPYVVKPNDEGSSVGIYIIKERDNRLTEIFEKWDHGDMMVEEYIPGRELTVTVMDPANSDDIRALTVTEICAEGHGFYDYDAKYSEGGSTHILPAPIPEDVFKACQEFAILAHKSLNCHGVTRTDFRYDDSKPGTQGLYYLETNTQPGMTQTSLVPEQAEFCGIDFKTLVSWMIENARLYS